MLLTKKTGPYIIYMARYAAVAPAAAAWTIRRGLSSIERRADMADKNRQYWNQQFKILQDTWPKPVDFEKMRDIFLTVHAMVHSRAVAEAGPCSFEDEMWKVVTEEAFRRYYPGDQSIAWKMWHTARIEDMTMNVLIAGDQQVFYRDGWHERLKAAAHDTGNAMNEAEIAELSNTIDINALKEYRNEIGRKTREVILLLNPQDLKTKVDPARLAKLTEDGDIAQGAAGLADYWSKKTYAGLLLMPATRHILVHLNESMKLLGKVK